MHQIHILGVGFSSFPMNVEQVTLHCIKPLALVTHEQRMSQTGVKLR